MVLSTLLKAFYHANSFFKNSFSTQIGSGNVKMIQISPELKVLIQGIHFKMNIVMVLVV